MGMPIEVVRSARRTKTLSARIVDGTIRVQVPASLSPDAEAREVRELVRRLERKHRSDHVDLEARAKALAARYELPVPRSVTWSDRQLSRWGSCSVHTGDIRVTRRLAGWPSWVLDYVLVHELAHLQIADHSPAFHALVARYPKAERAEGFLIAMSQYGDDRDGADPGGFEGGGLEGAADVDLTEAPPLAADTVS